MKANRGIILIAAYLIIAAMLILGAAFVGRSINEKIVAQRELESVQAFFIAEAGVDCGLDWLRTHQPPSGTTPFDPFGGAQVLGKGSYTVSIDPDDNNPSRHLKKYKIISQGIAGDVTAPKATREIISVKQRDSFARRVYFTDDEHFRWYGNYRIPVWFTTNDYLDGPTHSNSHLHISGNPLFAGPVSTTDNFISYMHGGPPNDNPAFQQGIQLGIEPIPMPSKALDLRSAAAKNGLRLNGTTTTTLKNNGTMDVTNANKKWVNKNVSLPTNGALFVEGGNLYISGALKGQLSVGSNKDVVITNNITYARDPRTNPSSQDKLGIIAEGNVVISKKAPYNLEVDASVMAMSSSFVVENWWSGLKGTLSLYGGIIQDERGPVGTFSSSTNQKVSGYTKNYRFDPRLAVSSPPFYPTTGNYITLSWEEE